MDGDPHSIFIFIFYKNMKKSFLFKWVAVLGAILLLANAVLPGLQVFAKWDESSGFLWNYVWNEETWTESATNWAHKIYYEKNSDEDYWCTNGWGHWGTCADKWWTLNWDVCEWGEWPDSCVQSWSGAISAPGAQFPWIAVAFTEDFKWTIKFNYEDYSNGEDYFPRGTWIREWGPEGKLRWAASIPEEFGNVYLLNNWTTTFNIDKFNISLVAARTLTIHYVYSNWEEAAEDYTWEMLEWTEYTHDSPEIANYTADVTTVSGTIADDVEVTVTYTPDNDEDGNWIADEVEWKLSALPAADGSYQTEISTDGKTITFKNISEKDPGAASDDVTWNGDRPAWYIWFGSRFTHPEAITGWATFGGETVSNEDKAKGYNDIWAWISATKVKELVEAWTLRKSREIPASYDGIASETFNIVVDLNNIEVKDTDENENTTLIKVVNWKITVLSWEEIKQESSNKSSWWGGGSSKTTKADDSKATTWDTAKLDENNTEENNEEKVNDENKDEEKAPMTDAQAVEKFGQEQIDAYKWALENGITTMKTVEAARLDEPLTRAELAKMMVVYIQKVLEKDPILTGDVNYSDVSEELGDLFGYIKLAYQYQIMWINADGTPIELFNPYGLVTRWEYATVFSRVLFGDKFNKTGEDFYTKHLEALKAAWILTNTIPTIQEMRGWVMLMMYRSSQNAEKIENIANTTETNEEEKADEETATASDETKSEANEKAEEATNAEAPTGDTAEATTWDVAETPTAEANTWDTASN